MVTYDLRLFDGLNSLSFNDSPEPIEALEFETEYVNKKEIKVKNFNYNYAI